MSTSPPPPYCQSPSRVCVGLFAQSNRSVCFCFVVAAQRVFALQADGRRLSHEPQTRMRGIVFFFFAKSRLEVDKSRPRSLKATWDMFSFVSEEGSINLKLINCLFVLDWI